MGGMKSSMVYFQVYVEKKHKKECEMEKLYLWTSNQET